MNSDRKWIADQQPQMELLLEQWVNINSGTRHLVGLARMADALSNAFSSLGGVMQQLSLPARPHINGNGKLSSLELGPALSLIKHPKAPFRLFLGGHMDTVFPHDSPFQKAERVSPTILRGPGSADMKGGLVILLTVLKALEQSPLAGKIGWEVLINPDEEIGSIGSRDLLAQAAKRNHVGLLFEPAFHDGSIASSRKGSANFTIVAQGHAAHAGRDFSNGRNALTALAKWIVQAEALNDLKNGTTVNMGSVKGGHAANIVPDLCICQVNARFEQKAIVETIRTAFKQLAEEIGRGTGVTLTVHEDTISFPKPFDSKQSDLFALLQQCGEEHLQQVQWKPSWGTCDGNRLHAEGLPNIDALGVVGSNLHTFEEYAYLPSLSERAQLVTLFIERLYKKYI